MKAAVVTAPGDWAVLDVPDPVPGPGEVVVEVERCGVCGTDLHVVDGDAPSLAYPVIPGHEFSARVVALGAGVVNPRLGTLVVVDPMVFCGHCAQCRSGWTNLCANGGGLGTTADGAFARYVKVDSTQCEPVPEGVPAAWAPLTEPLSCVLHALDRIGPVVGTDALVIGAGPAGLLLTRMLSLAGARGGRGRTPARAPALRPGLRRRPDGGRHRAVGPRPGLGGRGRRHRERRRHPGRLVARAPGGDLRRVRRVPRRRQSRDFPLRHLPA